MATAYEQGLSLAQVAALFSVTRQSAFNMLRRRGVPLRSAPTKPSVLWQGAKYSLRSNGYYARTLGRRTYLHRDVWEAENGSIPSGCDVHHLDEDKTNNAPDNLALHDKSEHGRRHGFGGNQHTGSLGRRPVKW